MENKRILITGFSGFVAGHFVEYLYSLKQKVNIMGIDINQPNYDITKYSDYLNMCFKAVDLTKIEEVKALFADFIPDYILHLAAYSSVAYSWKHPAESFLNNTNIFLNLIEEIKVKNAKCRILSVGSSEEYGNVEQEHLPIHEIQKLSPGSPYAVARVSQEMLSKIFVDTENLDIVLTRSFNHIGPRQDDRFVIPSFINRILQIEKNGSKKGKIETGDVSIIRDFVDVRDVVKAYYLLLKYGRAGEIYNICSGKAISLRQIINIIQKQLDMEIDTEINPEFIRPKDNQIIVGSAFKIENELGWKPEICIEDTIKDMIEWKKGIRG